MEEDIKEEEKEKEDNQQIDGKEEKNEVKNDQNIEKQGNENQEEDKKEVNNDENIKNQKNENQEEKNEVKYDVEKDRQGEKNKKVNQENEIVKDLKNKKEKDSKVKDVKNEKEKDSNNEIVKDSKKEKEKKELKQSNKDKKNNSEKKIREYIFIYFIENHDESVPSNIELDKNEFASDLEMLSEYSFLDNNIKYKYSIYRFKISNFKKQNKINVKIKLKNNLNKTYESKIVIKDFDIDNFLYDFKFSFPHYYTFKKEEIFNIYVNYLKKKFFTNQKTEENDNLILSTQKFILSQQKYEFSFYLAIFMECFFSTVSRKLIIEFDSKRIIGPGKFNQAKIVSINNILRIFLYKIEEKKLFFEKENEQIKFKVNLFAISLYFTFFFNKEAFDLLLNYEQMRNDIYSGLLKNYTLFESIELTKEQIGILIKLSSNLDELLSAFSFNKDALILIQLIKENFNKIIEIYNEAKKKHIDKLINIEDYINPNKEDNLEEISNNYISIIDLQIKSVNKIFIIFGKNLFDKYIDYFKQKNILYLFCLKDIYHHMKEKMPKISEYKIKNLDDTIHKNAIELSKKKELKNIEILEIINKEIYYKMPGFKKNNDIDILDGLDASTFNDEFYEKWKKMKWKEIFSSNYNKFIEKIVNGIKEMKYFKILIKLFKMSKNDEKKDFNPYAITTMQKKYIDLLQNYEPNEDEEKDNNNNNSTSNEDLIELILYSDKMKNGCKDFLDELANKYNSQLINNIYTKLLDKKISNNLKDIITHFFIENENNADSKTLLQLIDNCPSLRYNILMNFEKYVIKREEFFSLEETENIKLFQGLLEKKIVLESEFEGTDYVKNNIELISSIQNDIEKGNINYIEINPFYSNNKQEELKKKLLLISLNNEETALKLKEIIDDYINEIETIIEELNLINNDFKKFLFDSQKENINYLTKIIDKINNGYLNCYEKNYKERCQDLINTYKEKAQLRALNYLFKLILIL